MEAQSDRKGPHDWLADAACTKATAVWHWSEVPNESTALKALSVCESCPVVGPCRQDMVDSGERYPYQVRGGLRMWRREEVALLPPPSPEHSPVPMPTGGFPSSVHLKDKISLSRDANDEYYTQTPLHSHIPPSGRRTAAYRSLD